MGETKYDIIIKATIAENVVDGRIKYLAAAPMDRRASYTGSGLPFANGRQAFENTPNKGTIELGNMNKFEIKLVMPNSYYVGLGTVEVPPSLFIFYNNGHEDKRIVIRLGNSVPFRSLTYPTGMETEAPRTNAMFYAGIEKLPVRTQEEILRSAAYPETDTMYKNHWGLKPPV